MADMMMFPDTVEEFMEQYKIVDREQVYTNGTELVPIFRMEQWFEHKRGRWIKKRGEHMNTGEKVTFTVCSECGEMHEPTNYCPSCGAKMSETDS